METPMPPPKVILLDIGGVCVGSPFQAILDYEASLGVPPGWISYAISKSGPHGAWQRLEIGAIPLDDAFFAALSRDLHEPKRWRSFCEERQRDRKRPHVVPVVDAPRSVQAVTNADTGTGTGMDTGTEHPHTNHPPRIDTERLFGSMMAATSVPDRWMVPALLQLRASGRFILAALSNTVIFSPGHPLHVPDGAVFPADSSLRNLFDVVVSSAHEGVRKPDVRAYQLALDRVNEFAGTKTAHMQQHHHHLSDRGSGGAIAAGDVVFLDDIGENLREAARFGFRTIKVGLGRADEAVRTLERITRLDLVGEGCDAAGGDHSKAKI